MAELISNNYSCLAKQMGITSKNKRLRIMTFTKTSSHVSLLLCALCVWTLKWPPLHTVRSYWSCLLFLYWCLSRCVFGGIVLLVLMIVYSGLFSDILLPFIVHNILKHYSRIVIFTIVTYVFLYCWECTSQQTNQDRIFAWKYVFWRMMVIVMVNNLAMAILMFRRCSRPWWTDCSAAGQGTLEGSAAPWRETVAPPGTTMKHRYELVRVWDAWG